MKAGYLGFFLAGFIVLAAAACGDDDSATISNNTDAGTDSGKVDSGTTATFPSVDTSTFFSYCAGKTVKTVDFAPKEEQQLLDAVNSLEECTVVRLAAGLFKMPNALTIRQKGIYLIGSGKGTKGDLSASTGTVLDFTNAAANANGVDEVGDWFTIRDLAIVGAPNDALRIESSTNVRIQKVRAEWQAENATTNGKYGLYPVKSTNVLVEDSEAYNASDSGIYVGQTTNAIVRNNVAKQNVSGIEIENTLHAEVYGNDTEDNTTGLVVFDLPGNPTPGTDIKLHDNKVVGNNRPNFGASTVGAVPAGTGTFVMASRRVEITGNTYGTNNTVDVAVINGLSLDPVPAHWAPNANYFVKDVWVHGNTIQGGSGTSVDNGHPDATNRPLGAIVAGLYAYAAAANLDPPVTHVESFIWDGNPLPGSTAADVNLCILDNTLPTGTTNAVVDLDLPESAPLATAANFAGAWAKTKHYTQGTGPTACTGFTPALAAITLPE